MESQIVNEIFTKYYKDLYWFAFSRLGNKESSEDVVSDTFEKFLKNPKSEEVKGDECRAWLFAICRNTIFEKYRRDSKLKLDTIFQDAFIDEIIGNDDSLVLIQAESIISKIKNLDKISQEIILMRVIDDLRFDEISKVLSLNLDAVKKRYYRGIKNIQIQVNEENKSTKSRSIAIIPILFLLGSLVKSKKLGTSIKTGANLSGYLQQLYLYLQLNSFTAIGIIISILSIVLVLVYILTNSTMNQIQDSLPNNSLTDVSIISYPNNNLPESTNYTNFKDIVSIESSTPISNPNQSDIQNAVDQTQALVDCTYGGTRVLNDSLNISLALPNGWSVLKNEEGKILIVDLTDTSVLKRGITIANHDISTPIGYEYSVEKTITTPLGTFTGFEYYLEGKNVGARYDIGNSTILGYTDSFESVLNAINSLQTPACSQ